MGVNLPRAEDGATGAGTRGVDGVYFSRKSMALVAACFLAVFLSCSTADPISCSISSTAWR